MVFYEHGNSLLPPGLDVDYAIDFDDEELLRLVERTYQLQQVDYPMGPEKLSALAFATVKPGQALIANRKLAERLHRQRWYLIRDARAVGDSWATIGAVLGLSKQGAQDWFRRNRPEADDEVDQHG